mgnify:FL=1
MRNITIPLLLLSNPLAAIKVPEPKLPLPPRVYVCHRTPQPIIVDGIPGEASWQKADWTEPFVDIEGSTAPKPRFATRVKMLWNDEYFYFAAELEEPDVWATLTARDSIIYRDNDFEIFVDPDGDTHLYGELEINALNTVWDLLLVKPYRDGGPAIHSWDIQGLRTAVHVDGTLNDPKEKDRGWSIEVAIPWDVLKECVPGKKPLPSTGDQWRVNFSRVEYSVEVKNGKYAKAVNPSTGKPHPEANWVWSPQGLINMHYPEMWGYVQFSANPVGTTKDEFRVNTEERVKWALRKIYYRERAYLAEHGSFSDNLEALKLDTDQDLRISGWSFPPLLQKTDSQFEAVYSGPFGSSWHIRQDGLVWK